VSTTHTTTNPDVTKLRSELSEMTDAGYVRVQTNNFYCTNSRLVITLTTSTGQTSIPINSEFITRIEFSPCEAPSSGASDNSNYPIDQPVMDINIFSDEVELSSTTIYHHTSICVKVDYGSSSFCHTMTSDMDRVLDIGHANRPAITPQNLSCGSVTSSRSASTFCQGEEHERLSALGPMRAPVMDDADIDLIDKVPLGIKRRVSVPVHDVPKFLKSKIRGPYSVTEKEVAPVTPEDETTYLAILSKPPVLPTTPSTLSSVSSSSSAKKPHTPRKEIESDVIESIRNTIVGTQFSLSTNSSHKLYYTVGGESKLLRAIEESKIGARIDYGSNTIGVCPVHSGHLYEMSVSSAENHLVGMSVTDRDTLQVIISLLTSAHVTT
jgi:hypothetical protein